MLQPQRQVRSCEFVPLEPVRTNTLGAENVTEAAVDAGARRVVVPSTDKAVCPINAMGMSKAMTERLTVAKSRVAPPRGAHLCGTRYGSVIATRGSAIPLFIEQTKARRPPTVTDPTMNRFMMSTDAAVDLPVQRVSLSN